MPTFTPAALLYLWDDCADRHPLERSLALVASARGVPAETVATWPIGWVDAELLNLREAAFGVAMECEASCPACSARLEFALQTMALRVTEAGAEPGSEPAHCAAIRVDGFEIELRAPTVGDLLGVAGATPEVAAQRLLRASIGAARRGATDLPAAALHDMLPASVREAIEARLAELDPQADLTLALDCPECGHAWRTGFDIGAFLWREIGEWVRRTLDEVHLLARHYGWGEGAILALPAARRAWYVAKVLA